jgi:PAS domain S-box-containing protein
VVAGGSSDSLLLGAIRRLAAEASAGATSEDLAVAVAEEIISLLSADGSVVLRYDGDDSVSVGGAAAPGHQIFTRGARFPFAEGGVTTEVRRTRKPVHASDYHQREGDAPRRVTALGYRTVIAAPVIVGDHLWGVITAGTVSDEHLPPGTENDLEVFAELCAVVLAGEENLALLESQTAEQAALLSVSRSLLEDPGRGLVLGIVAHEATVLLGLESGAVLEFQPDGSAEVAAQWHRDPGAPVATGPDPVADLVRERREVVSVGDPDATARDPALRALGRRFGWGAPIEIDGELWGALVVAGDAGSPVAIDAGRRLARFAELSSLVVARVEGRQALIDQLVATQQFMALVELSDDFIAIADLDSVVTYLNPGGRRLVGLETLEHAQARSVSDFLTPEGLAASEEVEVPAVREHGSWQGEGTLRHQVTGEAIPVSINSFLVTHPLTGEPIALATVQRDLRERKKSEEELKELAAARRFLLVEALRAEERMRRQIGDALHDDVLQELYAARQDLEEVDGESDALHRARVAVDAAGRQLRDAVRDLHPAVSWTRDLNARLEAILEQGADRAGFSPRLEFDAQTPGDADDLVMSLVRELVQNVVKHAEASAVTVVVRDEQTGLVLEVRDDGRGMAPERPDEALRAGHIGLASARERVEALGGVFQVESDPGVGTRVRIVLPRGGLGLSEQQRP